MKVLRTRGAILLALGVLAVADLALAQSSGGSYTLRKSVLGGGAVGQGGSFRLVGTLGQPTATVVAGGSYRLTVGFHQSSSQDRLFCNGFESKSC